MAPNSSDILPFKTPWIKPVDSLILLYQLILIVVIGTGNLSLENEIRFSLWHLTFMGVLVAFLWITRRTTDRVVLFIKEFYPLMIVLFFYKEIGLLIHQYFDWTLDEWLFKVDNNLGRIGMSVWNFQQFYTPTRLMNEFFSIGYSFYFFLIPLSALVLYLKGTRQETRSFVFSISFVYYLHYLLFIFLPAESPRFFMPGLRDSLKGYWVSDLLQSAVEKNAFPGGSFPSSHVAASVICFMAYRYLGKWRFLVVFLVLAMFIGTVYGRYHYFIDVVAGLGVGLSCYYFAPWLEKKWPWILSEDNFKNERAGEALNRG